MVTCALSLFAPAPATSMPPTRICLVRHGETDWNREKRLQGHEDIPLNTTGLAQAEATARHLSEHDFSAIYSSDLSRALATAQTAASHLGLPVTPTEELRERHGGIFQGLTQDEAWAHHGEGYGRYRGRDPDYAAPGGESLRKVAERVTDFLHKLAELHEGESILVVSHGGVLDIAHRLATGKPLDTPRDFTISNAAVNWIEHQGGQWQLRAWDERPGTDPGPALDELQP